MIASPGFSPTTGLLAAAAAAGVELERGRIEDFAAAIRLRAQELAQTSDRLSGTTGIELYFWRQPRIPRIDSTSSNGVYTTGHVRRLGQQLARIIQHTDRRRTHFRYAGRDQMHDARQLGPPAHPRCRPRAA